MHADFTHLVPLLLMWSSRFLKALSKGASLLKMSPLCVLGMFSL